MGRLWEVLAWCPAGKKRFGHLYPEVRVEIQRMMCSWGTEKNMILDRGGAYKFREQVGREPEKEQSPVQDHF